MRLPILQFFFAKTIYTVEQVTYFPSDTLHCWLKNVYQSWRSLNSVESLAEENLFLKHHYHVKEKHETDSQWGRVFESAYVQLDSCNKY